MGEKAKKKSEEEVKEDQDQVKQESVNIKTEPDEVRGLKNAVHYIMEYLPHCAINK